MKNVLENAIAKTLSAIGTVLCVLIAGLIITAPVWMFAGVTVAITLLLGLSMSWLLTLVAVAMSIGSMTLVVMCRLGLTISSVTHAT